MDWKYAQIYLYKLMPDVIDSRLCYLVRWFPNGTIMKWGGVWRDFDMRWLKEYLV